VRAVSASFAILAISRAAGSMASTGAGVPDEGLDVADQPAFGGAWPAFK
jgi:hypothetical protein